MNVIDQFWSLCDDARQLAETTLNSREREPTFLAVLNFVKEHPENRAAFAYCFIHLFHWPELGPWNLIEYCMRELRWKEVQTHLAGIAAVTPEINCRYIANLILAAFEDVWPTGRIYARYGCPSVEETSKAAASALDQSP